MSYSASERVQDEAIKAMQDIDKKYLRRMQAEMHRCAANCCDDKESSTDKVQNCIDNCSYKLIAAQNLVQKEFENFRDRLERCYMNCNDSIKDKMSAIPNKLEIDRYRGELETCGQNCAETHINLISHILKRVTEFLNKRDFEKHIS